MSESDKDESLADAVFDEAPAEPEDVPTPDPAPPKPRRSASASVAWLALFLSMITVAGVGYLVAGETARRGFSRLKATSVSPNLSGRLSSAGAALSELDGSIDSLAAADQRNAAVY